jgi:hypothetical protein
MSEDKYSAKYLNISEQFRILHNKELLNGHVARIDKKKEMHSGCL